MKNPMLEYKFSWINGWF